MINSTFQEIASELIVLNQKHVDISTKLNEILTTSQETITVIDENNNARTSYSVGFLKQELDSVKESIKSLAGIAGNGNSVITQNGKSSLLIKQDLDQEGQPIDTLEFTNNFLSQRNFEIGRFFDPSLFFELNLSNKLKTNTEKVLVRKFSPRFTTDAAGNITTLGQTTRNSFLSTFVGKNNIKLSDWTDWFNKNRAGIISETIFEDFEMNIPPQLPKFSGTFDVITIKNENNTTYYVLDTIQYTSNIDSSIFSLNVGDTLTLNSDSSTTFKVLSVNITESLPKVVLERQNGLDIIPVGKAALKLVSPIDLQQRIKIPITFDEYCVIFVRPINPLTNIAARRWSFGVSFWSNDLLLSSTNQDNGLTLSSYYQDRIFDFGQILRDLAGRFQPTKFGIIPNPPVLDINNFKTVVANSHIVNSPNANNIRSLATQQQSLKSEIDALNAAIKRQQDRLLLNTFKKSSQKNLEESNLNNLNKKLESRTRQYRSIVDTISQSSNTLVNVKPEYRLRGFWAIPVAKVSAELGNQEVIQFEIQYKKVSPSGNEKETTTFKITNSNGTTTNAAFSEWIPILSKVRNRGYNRNLNRWVWLTEQLGDVDQPNINTIDLPFNVGEQIQIRVRSISEVGWPDALIKSEWSNILTIAFPDNLSQTSNELQNAQKNAEREENVIRFEQLLENKGLNTHTKDSITNGSKLFVHLLENIASGQFDANNNQLTALQVIQNLQTEVNSLKEQINNARGVLKISLIRGNNVIDVSNNQDYNISIVAEDYINSPNRNGIFKVSGYSLVIENSSLSSILNLLSNSTYNQSNFYPINNKNNFVSQSSRQATWINYNDEIITKNDGKTQNDFQWIWLDSNNSSYADNATSTTDNLGPVPSTRNNTSIYSVPSFRLNSRFAASVHPQINALSFITADNTQKKYTLQPGTINALTIPLVIYFSYGSGGNLNDFEGTIRKKQQLVTLNKKLAFHLDVENYTQPIKFNINFSISNFGTVPQVVIPEPPSLNSTNKEVPNTVGRTFGIDRKV